jgi:hypothetical protein
MKTLLQSLITAAIAATTLVACTLPEREQQRMPTEAEIEQYNASVEPDDRIICRDEKPVGTRISQRICRRAGTIEEVSDLSQREWRRLTITNN